MPQSLSMDPLRLTLRRLALQRKSCATVSLSRKIATAIQNAKWESVGPSMVSQVLYCPCCETVVAHFSFLFNDFVSGGAQDLRAKDCNDMPLLSVAANHSDTLRFVHEVIEEELVSAPSESIQRKTLEKEDYSNDEDECEFIDDECKEDDDDDMEVDSDEECEFDE